MTRGHGISLGRCLTVWLLVSIGTLVAWAAVRGAVMSLLTSAVWHGRFEDLLVAVASAVLLLCAAWAWAVTTATIIELVSGRVPGPAPRGLTRRLVLVACGAAVAAGVGSPALADGAHTEPPGADRAIVGLPLPDRAVGGPQARPAPQAAQPKQAAQAAQPPQSPQPAAARPAEPPAASITVRPGDSLWSIAAADLDPSADTEDIDAAWRELYAANREVIGSDPDLIRPGLDLEQPEQPDPEQTEPDQ